MSATEDLNFEELSARFGEPIAYTCLEHIERAAGISPREMTGVSPELRLAKAYYIQDVEFQSAQRMAA